MKAAHYDIVYLAASEWGNEKMREVAEEHFAAYPDCNFVQVHEHAGWYLGFRRDGSIWSTANDAADLPRGRPFPELFSGREVRR